MFIMAYVVHTWNTQSWIDILGLSIEWRIFTPNAFLVIDVKQNNQKGLR